MANSLAYGVYDYTASATGVGQVGRVDFNGANALTHFFDTTNVSLDGNIQNLTPDPKVFWFERPEGGGRLLVAQTYYDANYAPQPSEFSVYDAGTFEQKWPAAGAVAWEVNIINVYNIVIAEHGSYQYIYGIDYDNARVFRVRIGENSKGDETYTFDATYSYTYTSNVASYNRGVDIATDGSYIYALFIRSAGQYGGQYNTSALVRLSLPLTALAVSEEIAENAVNLKFWTEAGEDPTTWIYIPAIGGEQEYGGQYNDPSVIQRIPASFSSEDSPQTLLVNYQSGSGGTSQIVDQTNFYDISFNADGDKVFILKGVYNTSSNFTWHLFGTTMEVLNAASSALISAVVPSIAAYATGAFPNGFVWALPYDAADDVTWFVRGNEVLIYDYDGAALAATTAEMGVGDPAGTGYLATSGFNINGAAAYGFVGTIKGAAHPSKASVAARAAAASKAEEEK